MKNLVLAMALAAVSLTVVLVVMFLSDDKDAPGRVGRDPGRVEPALVPVLAGSGGQVDVLIRARYAVPERQHFMDRSLSRSLGVDPNHYGFVEAIVVNGSSEEVMVDPRALILETEEGRGTSGSDLNDLAKEGLGADGVSARVRTLLAVLAPPRSRPLGAQATRRLLVAVPADIDFGRVIEGRFLGLDLVTRDAGQEPLDRWLSRAQPGARLLEAVFDTPGESLAGDGR